MVVICRVGDLAGVLAVRELLPSGDRHGRSVQYGCRVWSPD